MKNKQRILRNFLQQKQLTSEVIELTNVLRNRLIRKCSLLFLELFEIFADDDADYETALMQLSSKHLRVVC